MSTTHTTPPTPRTLVITIEVDVTDGPRLKRGTREAELAAKIGAPMRGMAETLAKSSLGLETRSSRARIQWGYTWLDAISEDDPTDDTGRIKADDLAATLAHTYPGMAISAVPVSANQVMVTAQTTGTA